MLRKTFQDYSYSYNSLGLLTYSLARATLDCLKAPSTILCRAVQFGGKNGKMVKMVKIVKQLHYEGEARVNYRFLEIESE